jgi:hypothetical protein
MKLLARRLTGAGPDQRSAIDLQLGQTIIFVRTRATAHNLHRAVRRNPRNCRSPAVFAWLEHACLLSCCEEPPLTTAKYNTTVP